MSEKVKGFRVTVEGDFYVQDASGKGKELRKYKVDVNVITMDSALSVIKNKLLAKALTRKYPGFLNFRTHTITNVDALDGASLAGSLTILEMNRDQIAAYIESKKLPVNMKVYPEMPDLRDAIRFAETTPKLYPEYERKVSKENKENEDLKKLNPELNDAPAEEEKEKKKEEGNDYTEKDDTAPATEAQKPPGSEEGCPGTSGTPGAEGAPSIGAESKGVDNL